MSSSLFKEYAELIALISSLEVKKESLQVKIMDEMDSDGLKEKVTKYGSFFSTGKTTYEYSSKIKELQNKVYQAKKEEEASGVAVIKSATAFLRFSPLSTKNE